MNLFRSEEHARRWADFNQESVDGIKPVAALAEVFRGPLFSERLAGDYIRRVPEHVPILVADLDRLGGGSPFWQMPAPAE